MRTMVHSAVMIVLAGVAMAGTGCHNVATAREDFALTAPWSSFKRVEVRVVNGSIEVKRGAGQEAKITGRKQAGGDTQSEADANLKKVTIYAGPADQHPDVLLVELRFPDELRNRNVGANVVIEAPQSVPVRARGSNGAIRIDNMSAADLETSNGAIDATKIDGALTAKTSNGAITAQDVAADLSADTNNGKIQAAGVRGAKCALRTTNGGIHYEGERTTTQVELHTSNGEIVAKLPPELAAALKCDTTNGHVKVNLASGAIKIERQTRTSFAGAMNGGGGSIRAETSNGGITIEPR